MNFGAIQRSALAAAGTAWLVAASLTAAGEVSERSDWTVEQLVALLKAQRETEVRFEEATYSSLLTEPLTARGILRFSPPATMEKEVREPRRERYLVEGDHVVIENSRKGIKKTVSLSDYPALRSLVEAFRASFMGNAERLQEVYETTVGGDPRKWTLLLRPRESEGRTMVDYILFSGREGRIDTIAIRAPDGDRSVMTLRRGTSK